jgi:hypothetical protein
MRPEQGSPVRADTDAAALLDRLQKLRNLLPAFAQETAAARREAARLRLQNTKLQTRLAELEARPRQHDTTSIDRRSPTPRASSRYGSANPQLDCRETVRLAARPTAAPPHRPPTHSER